MDGIEHVYIEANRITLHVAKKGPKDGKLVILLHGFPEFWYGWHKQIDYLANQGFRVWAPDQRGYNLSDKPEKVSDYDIRHLTKDIAGLIKASGREKATIVGHDWGGIISWRMAREYSHLLDRVVILNAPHEKAMSTHLMKHPTQLIRSSYAVFFQLRGLPEKLISLSDWKVGTTMLKSSSLPHAFSEEDLKLYRQAWSKPQAMKSMINWYRGNVKSMTRPDLPAEVTLPTLLIWGAQDQFLGKELAEKSSQFIEKGRLVFLENATHWVHLEEADRVNALIAEFI